MKNVNRGALQRGITMIGFIMVLIILGFFAYIGMRIVPMYIEYFGVVKAIKHIVSQPDIATADEYKIRDLIAREFDVGYVASIEPKDVKLKRLQNGIQLSIDYEVRKPFAGNIELLGHFQKTVSSGPASAAGD